MRARPFGIPAGSARAALMLLGAWLVAHAFAGILVWANGAGGMLLPDVPAGPNAWRPARPLGDLPQDAQQLVATASPLLALALLAWGFASWRDPAARGRLLVAFALVDTLLVLVAYQAATVHAARPTMMLYALSHAQSATLALLGVTLAWTTRGGRRLALAGVAAFVLAFASVYLLEAGLAPSSFFAHPARLTAYGLTRSLLWAVAPGLIGAGILLASRATPPPRGASPASEAAARAEGSASSPPSTR